VPRMLGTWRSLVSRFTGGGARGFSGVGLSLQKAFFQAFHGFHLVLSDPEKWQIGSTTVQPDRVTRSQCCALHW
jgi:hypothetical protein